jgi:hypothetical protein
LDFSSFRKRMGVKGKTDKERKMNQATRYFQKWFDGNLAKEEVSIDGVAQDAVFHDQNQNNNKDLSDDKYIMVENKSNMKVGSYVKWREKIWMVFTDEHKTIPTHKQAKIKESNHKIKWKIGDKICNGGEGYNAFIQNQTLYTLGVSSSGNHAWLANAKMMMYLPDNSESRALRIGQRIIIGGAVYQVFFKDYVSREGLINYLLEQDMTSTEYDNLELGIADYYPRNTTDTIEETPSVGVAKEVVIVGAEKARISSLVTYGAKVLQDGAESSEGISEWTVVDTESSITVESQTEESITIRVVNNFKKVGSTITIIGKTSDGTIGSKTVNIISPY